MSRGIQPERPSLLRVRALSVDYRDPRGAPVEAVRDIDLTVRHGEAVGVLGESGSGKSTLAMALMGLLPPAGRVVGGGVEFEGTELLALPDAAFDRLRGNRIAMVFQEPGLALSPVLRVGGQIVDVLRAHRRVTKSAARERALELLARVRVDAPESVFDAYPHQLSGGQLQRVALAQALMCEPALLIADEPTAALDTIAQAALVELLRQLLAESELALLFITHDPHLLHTLADRLVVMYAGRAVEQGPADELRRAAAHPYLRELWRCLPEPIVDRGPRAPLHVIPGAPPSLAPPPRGCAFEPRCAHRLERCAERPGTQRLDPERTVACWNPTRGAA